MSRATARLWFLSALVALLIGCGASTNDAGSVEDESQTTREALGSGQLYLLTHIQNIGDQWSVEGAYAGTRGQSLRLEGFAVQTSRADLQIQYMAHIEGTGDTGWLDSPQFIGTRGQGKRLEGFAMRLFGPAAATYDIWYMCHIQDFGDTVPMMNGAFCGTRGKSKRIEGMTIWVTPKVTCGWNPLRSPTGCDSDYVEGAGIQCIDSKPGGVNDKLRVLVASGCSVPIYWTAEGNSTKKSRAKKILMCPTSLTSYVNSIGQLEYATRPAHVSTTFCDRYIPLPPAGYMWAVVWDDPTCGAGGCMDTPDW